MSANEPTAADPGGRFRRAPRHHWPPSAPSRAKPEASAPSKGGRLSGACEALALRVAPAGDTALQRAARAHGPPVAPPIVHSVLRSPGRALDPGTRAHFESRLGHDFGAVRLHTDSRAADSARAVNALTYTVGRDIVFARDGYRPGTATGGRLLAHELSHVVQQRGAGAYVPARLPVAEAGSDLERAADGAAEAATAGRTPTRQPPLRPGAAVAVMRQPATERPPATTDEALIDEAKAMIAANRLDPLSYGALLRKFAKGRVTPPQGRAKLLAAGGGLTFAYIPATGPPGRPPLYGPYLSVGEDFVHRVARGDLGALATELAAVVQEIDAVPAQATGQAPAAAPAAQPAAPQEEGALGARTASFRVILVMLATLDPEVITALRSEIKRDFDAIAASSAKKTVKAGFEVIVRNDLSATDVSGLDRRDFVAYVVSDNIKDNKVKSILSRHLNVTGDDLTSTTANVMNQIKSEGGANAKLGTREVSFLAKTKATETLGQVKAPKLASAHEHAGRRIAELGLHEIGHGLGLEHGSGIMAGTVDQTIYPGEQLKRVEFTAADQAAIRKRLEALVPP